MKKLIHIFVIVFLMLTAMQQTYSQEYTFDDFVGTWHGTIVSTTSNYNYTTTLVIEQNGFYTESSGHLMPSLYPNTQECEFDAPTNRMHFWYLGTVWGGQYFYDHFFYEVVSFDGNTLEMHYNYWDDPEPHPEVTTIFLVKEILTPAPSNLEGYPLGNNIVLSWEEPSNGGGAVSELLGYNLYHKEDMGTFELLEYVENTNFGHENISIPATHAYYVTAVYTEGESNPSNEVEFEFLTPPPTSLEGELLNNNVSLSWVEPSIGNTNNSQLEGYNIYHKGVSGTFELLDFVESNIFTHENILVSGFHSYYVTAVYNIGESDPSNEVEVEIIISGIEDEIINHTSLYPNPASDIVNIQSEYDMNAMTIYNHTGQIVFVSKVNSKNYRFNVSDLDAGLYLFLIETNKGSVTKRILVQ